MKLRENLVSGFWAALAMILPSLVGYVVYDQVRTPVFDARMDWASGEILEVKQDSLANWAGFWPGDVILSINGKPYPQLPAVVGNYPSEVQRGGETLTLEMPWAPMAKVNLPALLGGVLTALVFWASGLLLLLRRFAQAEIRLLFLLSQTLSIAILFSVSYSPNWSPPAWGMDLSVACLFVSAPLLLHHYLTFPARPASSRLRRWGLLALYILAGVIYLAWIIVPFWGRTAGMAYVFFVMAAAIGALGWSYFRRASADDRRRLRLIFFGSLFGALPALLFFFLPSIFDAQRIPLWLAGLFTVAAPLSYLYAILRHNLFGIDRLLNRTLVYAALSLGILFLYLGPFLFIYRFAPGDWLAQTMAASGLTLAVGLAFERTRTALQRFVGRLFYGGWYDYPGVVEQVTRALAGCVAREQWRETLTRQIPALMQLQQADLYFDDEPLPAEIPPGAQFPLNFQGRRRALWIVGPHRDRDELSESDLHILDTLARQAELALGNVLLIETLRAQLNEIRASREALSQAQHRLLRSREEERARLARDLHDGPLQGLIGLSMQLGLLASQRGDLAGLNEMRGEVRGLLDELRGVCSQLRPPMLDTLGLAAALRALAEEWSAQTGLPVHLDLPPHSDLPLLPEEVAVNLYRLAQEALSNIARHAQARRVDIALLKKGEGIEIIIADDGRGFAPPGNLHDLVSHAHPRGVAARLVPQHLCCASRGKINLAVRKPGTNPVLNRYPASMICETDCAMVMSNGNTHEGSAMRRKILLYHDGHRGDHPQRPARPPHPGRFSAIVLALAAVTLACKFGQTPSLPTGLAEATAPPTESQPRPLPSPSGDVVNPADLEYLGAFRLPGGEDRPLTFAYGGNAMTVNPNGDPGGAADGFPGSLFITGHDRMPYGDLPDGDQVAEVTIPAPISSRNIEDLNTAEFIQEFQEVAAGHFTEYDEIPKVGMQYLDRPETGPKIHIAWGEHLQSEQFPTHGWFNPNLSAPDFQGEWFIGNQDLYSVNGYMFEIPAAWAEAYTGGRYLATGRMRDGGQGGMGPTIFAYRPWNADGSPPPSGTRLEEVTLLLYENAYNTEDIVRAMNGYQHPDAWEGGAWLTTPSGKQAVLFAGTKSNGTKYWYGYINPGGPELACVDAEVTDFTTCRNADGSACPQGDFSGCCDANAGTCVSNRGWWTTRFDAQFILYDPADLAKVASGQWESWQPQPYAIIDIDEHLYLNPPEWELLELGWGDQRRYRIGDVAYDRVHNLIYVLELFADGAAPVVHVWRVP